MLTYDFEMNKQQLLSQIIDYLYYLLDLKLQILYFLNNCHVYKPIANKSAEVIWVMRILIHTENRKLAIKAR